MKSISFRRGNVHRAHLAIAGGMIWVLLFAFVARLAGVGREIAIANRYGTGPVVDAYLFVSNLITWPVSVWFGVLCTVLLPMLTRMRETDLDRRRRTLATLLGASLCLGGALGLAAWLILPSLAASPAVGLAPEAAAIAPSIAALLWPLLPLGFAISLYSVWVMSAGHHANTLMEGIPALAIAAAVLLGTWVGVVPLIWGTLAGFLLQFAALAIYIGRRSELAAPRLQGAGEQLRLLWYGFGLVGVGQIFSTTTGIVDQLMAAPLGTGAIATLGYANRILMLLTGLSALVITRAALPVVSRLEADPSMSRIALHWAGLLFVVGTAAALCGYWITPVAVPLLFQGGAFTPRDSAQVAAVLSFGLPQLPFFCAGLVLTAQLAATGRYWAFAVIGGVNLAVKVAANWMLIPQFGIGGITLASAVMYAVSATLLLLIVATRPRRPVSRDLVSFGSLRASDS